MSNDEVGKTLRMRGWSNVSEDLKSEGDKELSEHERQELLNAFPTSLSSTEKQNSLMMEEDDVLTFQDDRGGLKCGERSKEENFPVKVDLQQIAKQRLSKWSARLLDPNRPRGLIETPKIIPLNDEFLSAFGKREKQDDIELNRNPVDIVPMMGDDDDDDGGSELVDALGVSSSRKKKRKKSDLVKVCVIDWVCFFLHLNSSFVIRPFGFFTIKIKIINLSYTTTETELQKKCEEYGTVLLANLIMDEEMKRSSGRAYVTFDDAESDQACIDNLNLKTFHGRKVTVHLAAEKKPRKSGGGPGLLSRFWEKKEKNLSLKCYRCGKVGHMIAECNGEVTKVCALCAGVGHEYRSCPISMVCFNCGVPGHSSRNCTRPRGMPNRLVCGTCFESGHHRWQCRVRPWHISSHGAICISCGQAGHFMCRGNKVLSNKSQMYFNMYLTFHLLAYK